MYFHARLIYGLTRDEIAVNLSKYELYQNVALAFIAGQVVDLPLRDGIQLVNMKAVVRLVLYETPDLVDEVAFFDQHREGVKDCTANIIQDVRRQIGDHEFRSVLELSMAPPKSQAFVICKFGDRHIDSAYVRVVKPAFERFGLSTKRIDEIEDSGRISDQILNHIAESRLVFSDLSGERPNCYYETGFAHALGRKIILAIRSTEAIHFDLKNHRFIVYETEQDLEQQLLRRLQSLNPGTPTA